MKHAAGEALEEILFELEGDEPGYRERCGLHTLLGIFRQVCLGIEHAHSRGIIDWGIAKVAGGGEQGMRAGSFETGKGKGLGTPGCLAPEQSVDAGGVDGRADVYALGAILFELLTLEPLHEGEDVAALLASTQLGKADARVSVRRPDLDVAPELERACVLATATGRRGHLASVAGLRTIVAGYLDGDRDLALRRTLTGTLGGPFIIMPALLAGFATASIGIEGPSRYPMR